MPCFHPKPAWQAKLGSPLSFSYVRNWRCISVPCNTCVGCIKAQAQAWAFRCHQESIQHLHNAFTTLTYDETNRPWTLDKQHLAGFLKRLRDRLARRMGPQSLKFFASGEYGTHTHRPHYHAILFGYNAEMGSYGPRMVEEAWGHGHTRTSPATPARIAYTAAYTAKKSQDRFLCTEWCDPETGEAWQPPFIQMSRGGRTGQGIGSHARHQLGMGPHTKEVFEYHRRYHESWRLFAIQDGTKLPVPRYYNKAWKDYATEQELRETQAEKDKYIHSRDNSQARLEAGEQIAIKKQKLAGEKRQY